MQVGRRDTLYDRPGKSWFAMLRLYGPLASWFDKTWRPSEIEPVSGAIMGA